MTVRFWALRCLCRGHDGVSNVIGDWKLHADTAYGLCIGKVQIFICINICILPLWRSAYPHIHMV